MSNSKQVSPSEAADEFWKHLAHGATVMLGVNAPDRHSQPMTAFPEAETNAAWFFTRDDLDLVAEAKADPNGRLVLASKDQEVFADVRGTLEIVRDRARVERYWNPMVAAWYPDGKDDPHLVFLRFSPAEGQIWVSKQGLIQMIFQVAKANITHTPPDVGGVAEVTFRH
jgi:general stress protein 26